jgi:aryl-alcohol dehydrogenase-like predicted oxidoreductase
MVVVTKIAHIGDDTLTDREAEAHVERSVLSSLARLRLPVLPICLFHQEQDFRYIEALRTMQTKGLIRYIGCSVMTPQGAKAILATGEADALQVPVNLLDRRFEQSGIFRDAADKSIAVFGRSVYLQGLLLMAEADIPSALQSILAIRRELQTMAMGASLSLAEMAARYVLGMEGLSCALVGMETVEQMKKNLSYFLKGPLPADLNAAIVKIVPTLPEAIVNPSLWPARQEPTPGR